MNRQLLWKLLLLTVIGSVVLMLLVHWLIVRTELHMSFIDEQHQATLQGYANHAATLYQSGDMDALQNYIEQIQVKESTWVAVVKSDVQPIAGSQLLARFMDSFVLGRDIGWKIHLYFKLNPIMDLNLGDKHTHFLILLPQRMRPGSYWPIAGVMLKIFLPVFIMGLISLLIYRHVMRPLHQLQKATRKFSDGNYDVRVLPDLKGRHDELADVAKTFDDMAERISSLITHQRHLTEDLSHELRTPLTRIELALDSVEDEPQKALKQIRSDCDVMRRLVHDSLTLAWLDRDQPSYTAESFDLRDLLDSLVDNAQFEFPDRQLIVDLPEHALIDNSQPELLGQALENILRNALSFTPASQAVTITLQQTVENYLLTIIDSGPGVSEVYLSSLFKPFFRLPDNARNQRQGYGLGLAITQRYINRLGGQVFAEQHKPHGLKITVMLPIVASLPSKHAA